MNKNNYAEDLTHPIFEIITGAATEIGNPAYVIGGFVRDLIMQRPCTDIDIVTIGNEIELAQKVAKKIGPGVKVTVFRNFKTAMLQYQQYNIEFVGARKESYKFTSRKPDVEPGTLQDDQNRRDFTINALALSLQTDDYGNLIDPFSGIDDIENKTLRTPLNPDTTFSDDPLRMLRGIRFATQLDFEIEQNTWTSIIKNRNRIEIVSGERVTEELNKIILAKTPSKGFKLLESSGLLELILPQLLALKGAEFMEGIGHKDNFYHTLQVLDNLAKKSDNLWLRWAALLHDIGKPATKRFTHENGWTFHGHDYVGSKMIPGIFKKLRLPLNEKMKYVQKMVLMHLRPIALTEEQVTDSAVRRLLFEAGDDIDDLMLLSEADITSKNPNKVRRFLNNFALVRQKLKSVEEADKIRNWQPPISGEIIMDTFGLPPCREIGIIKTAIREAILDGVICNNFEEAFEMMIKEGEKLGFKPIK
ncbi:MAG: HD domain-containing protein [Bacteroidales bacterium]|jgi:poly(A) polymerase|nr:HD domain-containing protein [Bacteroidales bacterium]